MKTKLLIFTGLVITFLTLSGFSQKDIEDNAHVLNKETKQLITAKNNRYWQTKEQPQVVVKTVTRLNHLTPKRLNKQKNKVFIVIGVKKDKKNVQIFSTKDLHGAFTAESRASIIRAAGDELRSDNNTTFNKGVRFVFRACATKVDQQYQYTLDKYDLTDSEQNKISHPRKVALPIALALVVVVAGMIYVLRGVRVKNNKK
ncbi:TPM domain-containing protein [Lactobacillus sp. LL6]|uniref:TPM domain-containing protein n=1 Tax=Lactobacillus sp. LL6 TaxID=2596827 RepID=UPI001186634A|nr:TPM domain-containing protein [Lactobacillus sp. LL6]TSO27046.1 TPM domain-containing protein [Lactobacillus sp. LL6]